MIPEPYANPDLIGQEETERLLLQEIGASRLPHALILSGNSGIGKATLAWRLARYLLAPAAARTGNGLGIDSAAPVARRLAARSHPDLVAVGRRVDADTGKVSREVAVEDVRTIAPFLRMTPAEGGWRVAIIDDASHLNRAGQNALLKILEEPPPRSILVLITDRPGALLPTVHSRCRPVRMRPLPPKAIEQLLARFLPELEDSERVDLARLAEGSIGRALHLAEADGLALYRETAALLDRLPEVDWTVVHAFSERLGNAAAEPSYRLFGEFLRGWMARLIRSAADAEGPAPSRLDRWVDACEKVGQRLSLTDSANLDRKLAVWAAFEMLARAAAP